MEQQELKKLTRIAHCDKHGEYEKFQKECHGPGQDELGNPTVVKFLKWTGHCAKCIAEAIRREEERKTAEARYELQERIRASGIPKKFLANSLDSYIAENPGQKRALEIARGYASNFDEVYDAGRNLLFTGKPGCGKTHLAAAIGMALLEMGGNVRYVTASDMVRRFTDTWGRHDGPSEKKVLADLTSTELLILDEAGMQSGSDVELRIIFNVIDGRYREGRPTLVVSNLSTKSLTPYVGERVMDRLRDNGSQLVAFDWDSWRGGKKEVRNAA